MLIPSLMPIVTGEVDLVPVVGKLVLAILISNPLSVPSLLATVERVVTGEFCLLVLADLHAWEDGNAGDFVQPILDERSWVIQTQVIEPGM